MSNDPDKIRAEIDQTRRDLSRNVDALGEQVNPSNVARRQKEKVGDAVSSRIADVRERVMGVADDVQDRFADESGRADELRDEAGRRVESAQRAVADAPETAKRRTQGNPLAAGLIALGAGWLLGSLIPSSRREQEASVALKEKAQPLADGAQQWAKEAGEHLREPAEAAVADLKASASAAAENVKSEGQQVADDVKTEGQHAVEDVKGEGQRASQDIKAEGEAAAEDVKAARDAEKG